MALSKISTNQLDSTATPTFAELDVDNVKVNGNTISSTNTNGDITLDPNGTGDTTVSGRAVITGASTTTYDATAVGGQDTAGTLKIQNTDNNADVFAAVDFNTNNDRVVNRIVSSHGGTTNNGFLAFVTEGSGTPAERMRIDSSGQVMIGTTTAGGQFTVTEGDATTIIDRVGTNVAGIKTGSGDDFCVGTADYSQAIRIKNNSGHVGIGTVAPSNAQLCVENSANENAGFILNSNASMTQNTLLVATARNTTDGTYNHFQCAINGVAAKLIVYDGGQVVNATNSYGQISDQRLKENIADASSQWDDIKALQVRNFNFIGDDLTQIGVVAQEVEAAGMNGLIQEAAWYNAASNPDSEVRKTVKYSVLYMKAVKALQEAMTRIETLEAKVAALEAG